MGQSGLREQKKQQRRERIIAAALRAFNDKGFAATSMKQIAGEAGLAVGTLYNYFPSKNGLLLGIISNQLQQLRDIELRQILDLFRSESQADDILSQFIEPLVEQFAILSKKSWQEVLAAFFASEGEFEQLITMDLEAIGLTARGLRLLQGRHLIRRDVSADSMAETLYSIVMVQFFKYVYFAEWSEEQFREALSLQLHIAITGMEDTSS